MAQNRDTSGLGDQNKKDAVEKASGLSPHLIHDVVRRDGEEELNRSFKSLAWSGLAAGILISFSIIGKALFSAYLPDADWSYLVINLGYAFGFLLVVLGRMQLFTENTIVTVLPVINRPCLANLRKLVRLWCIVLTANVIGCFVAALVIATTAILPDPILVEFRGISEEAMTKPAFEAFIRGNPAGLLIAGLVWMLPQAAAAGFWVILLFTWLIGVCGFTHIVAGTVEMAFTLIEGSITLEQGLLSFFLPVFAGNVLGGTAIFTFLAWAQVVEDVEAQEEA